MSRLPRPIRKAIQPVAVPMLLAWERIESGVSYNPTSNKVIQYPYDKYEEIRRNDPVHRLRLIDGWVLTQYEDVNAVLRDWKRFSNDDGTENLFVSMLGVDPPGHTRLRSLVSRAFTPRSVAELDVRIEQIVDGLIDDLEGQDRFDLIDSFAYPVPVMVIAEMLGIPPEDRELFKEWSNDVSLVIEPIVSDEQHRRIVAAGENLFNYFEDIIEQRRREPQDDLITALIAAEEEGDRLSREELLGSILLLLVAGNETTRNLIGNGMLALMRNPDQFQMLRDDPSLMESAITEFLRYDSPVQLDGRRALEDCEIGGKRIKAEQQVISMIGAANHDPAVFTNPHELDITRKEESHVSFGRGIHYCLGSPLALLEGRIAFTALLDRFSDIRLVAEPEFREQIVLRGAKELWVEVGRPSRSGTPGDASERSKAVGETAVAAD